jgi:hypothetical protein
MEASRFSGYSGGTGLSEPNCRINQLGYHRRPEESSPHYKLSVVWVMVELGQVRATAAVFRDDVLIVSFKEL